eukprot:SM000068S20629  [mRNA]  locus=s68:507687:509001:- [translate_table: standard]
MAAAAATTASALASPAFLGSPLPARSSPSSSRAARPGPLRIAASGGKKTVTKTPNGPSGNTKFRAGKDASGSKAKASLLSHFTGKGVYMFTKKYGANVDGYSPIYTPEIWSKSGDSYAYGNAGLAAWAGLLATVLLGGAFLVYSTSSFGQ